MKSFGKNFWIIALAAIIAASMFSACGGGADDGGESFDSGISLVLADRLEFSGPVYVLEYYGDGNAEVYPYTGGDITFATPYGGSGGISNGQLNFSIGKPDNMGQLYFNSLFGGGHFSSITASNPATGVFLDYFDATGCITADHCYLRRYNASERETATSYFGTYSFVFYVYVANDVTVSGKGITETYSEGEDGITLNETFTSRDFSLALATGWNSVHFLSETRGNYSSNTYTYTTTVTVSRGNPPLRWHVTVFRDCDTHYTGSSRSMMNRSAANEGQSAIREFKTPYQMKGNRLQFNRE